MPVPEKSKASRSLTVEGADKSYGNIRALDNVSLTISPGECLGLIGRNGAGKTTLIDAICGRIRLDRGVIGRAGRGGASLCGC